MSESDPIQLSHRQDSTRESNYPADGSYDGHAQGHGSGGRGWKKPVFFNRRELDTILQVYGQKVAASEWRDYAIDQSGDEVIFSVFRRTSEMALYRIVKAPKDARRQGAYRVIGATGMILKRGQDLAQVLKVFQKRRLSVV